MQDFQERRVIARGFRNMGLMAAGILGSAVIVPTAFAEGAAPTCTVSMAPAKVKPGEGYVMTWNSTNAAKLSLTFSQNGKSLGSNPVAPSGSIKASHEQAGTYVVTITPSGPGGTGKPCTATVVVAS